MLPTEPSDGPTASPTMLEEWKQLIEERRFVMRSYMQALALYLALGGYALKELLASESPLLAILIGLFFTSLNGVAVYAASRFKSMAMHAIEQEEMLATSLGIKTPHSLTWGYNGGICVVIFFQLAVISAVALKMAGRI
jgi:hypothetical protein